MAGGSDTSTYAQSESMQREQKLRKRIAELEAEIKRAFIAGYHTGHDHTVEGCFQWCDQGSSEVADDWIADDAEDKALEDK